MDILHGGITLPKKLTGTPANLTKIAKYFQFPVMFERELKLWEENPIYDGIPLHVYLYHNRLMYLGKKPNELTDLQILNGLHISGVMRQYTKFDTTVMSSVLDDYHVKSVYDPCAGWGERLLCCFSHGIDYLGVDINQKLAKGYADMMAYYHIDESKYRILFQDSSTCDLSHKADMVFTCPPYGDIEIYTDVGAENLSNKDFLSWWDMVVKTSIQTQPVYFAFQINRRFRDEMLQRVLDNGFDLVEERSVKTKTSHFNRKNGENHKRETETVLICKRV